MLWDISVKSFLLMGNWNSPVRIIRQVVQVNNKWNFEKEGEFSFDSERSKETTALHRDYKLKGLFVSEWVCVCARARVYVCGSTLFHPLLCGGMPLANPVADAERRAQPVAVGCVSEHTGLDALSPRGGVSVGVVPLTRTGSRFW